MKEFNADAHVYRVTTGRIPGATDVIKGEGLINSDWMTEDARWRGKCVHRGVELLVKDALDWDTVDEMVLGYLRSAEAFLRTSGFVVIGAEQPCFDDAFACMPDLWGALHTDHSIIELKTGPVPKWAAIQTALQRRALIKDKGFTAKKRFGLQLMPDGSLAKLIPFANPRDDYRAMEMVDVFHWKLENGYLRDWQKNGG